MRSLSYPLPCSIVEEEEEEDEDGSLESSFIDDESNGESSASSDSLPDYEYGRRLYYRNRY